MLRSKPTLKASEVGNVSPFAMRLTWIDAGAGELPAEGVHNIREDKEKTDGPKTTTAKETANRANQKKLNNASKHRRSTYNS